MKFPSHPTWASDGLELKEQCEPITFREETVKWLIDQIRAAPYNVVFIRGPRFTGKTALLQLVKRYLECKKIPCIYGNLDSIKREEFQGVRESESEIYLLLDEAPLASETQWSHLKELYTKKNVKMLLVGAYPYPKSGIRHENPAPFTSPMDIKCKLGIKAVYSRGNEANELIESFNRLYSNAVITSGLAQVILHWCQIPGSSECQLALLRHILLCICEKFPGEDISEELVASYVMSFGGLRDFLSHRQSDATRDTSTLDSELKNIIWQVIDQGEVVCDVENAEKAEELCKRGILHFTDCFQETGYSVNSTRIGFLNYAIRAVCWNEMFNVAMINPLEEGATTRDLIFAALRRMDKSTLKGTYSLATKGGVLERQWQMEFYRAMFTCVGNSIISTDVGKVFNTTGLLDFYINGTRQLAVELVRDGNKIQEHIERFSDPNKYEKIIRKDWVVIHFISQTGVVLEKHAKLWNVKYSDGKFLVYPPEADTEPQIIELFEKVNLNAEEIAEIDARTRMHLLAESKFRKRKAEMEETEVRERIERERRKAAMDELERRIKYWSDQGDREKAKKCRIELEKLMD
jgi:hypothetical protein